MTIKDALQTLIDNGLPTDAIVPIVNDLISANGLEDDADQKYLALVAEMGAEFIKSWINCDVSSGF